MGNSIQPLRVCILNELAALRAEREEISSGEHGRKSPNEPLDEAHNTDPFYAKDAMIRRQAETGILHMHSFLDEVEHIPIGNYCMLSLAMKAMGLRKCSYPLDYTRSSVKGVIQLYLSNFADFLTGTIVKSEEHGVIFQNTAWGGSFWHHDISKGEVRHAMHRRVDRLLARGEVPTYQPRMFYRTVNHTDELDMTPILFDVLRTYYAGPVRLVTFIEMQDGQGPICLRNNDEQLFYRIHHQHTMTDSQWSRIQGFLQPIAFAMKFFAGETLPVQEVESLPDVKALCDVIDGGDPAVSLFAPSLIGPATKAGPLPKPRKVPPLQPPALLQLISMGDDDVASLLPRSFTGGVSACMDTTGMDPFDMEDGTGGHL
mmetsp:Transcript_52364/g.96943  ORF Transcript_52364/g.96943 Transcript_52364/m.96943 type:complete len:372 (-) Transcript_52364:94-1209(-)